jgi:ABC-type branched-subunit amino acid transport system substrate-binding protein
VDKERIQVATLLPLQGRQGALGRAMAQIMHAHFQEVNRAGGVFGRRIELLVIPYDTSPAATLDKLRKAFEQEGIFALVGAYTVGLDEAVLEALRAQEAPLVGPFTLSPGDEVVNAGTFYLYPGFADQARVLAEEARKVGPGRQGGLLVVGPEGDQVDALVAAVRDQLGMRDAAEPLAMRYPAGALDAEAVAAQVQASSSEAVLFFGDQTDLTDLLGVLAERRQSPGIYLLSSLAPRALFDAPPAFHQRIFLAYPTLSRDISASGRAEYQRLARDHGLPPDHLQGQIAAYAAAKLLVHGLRGAGRNLSRLGLVDALEGLYAYETGLTPPLSYGPNRRVGARGAYVVAVDLLKRSYQPIGGWHNLR